MFLKEYKNPIEFYKSKLSGLNKQRTPRKIFIYLRSNMDAVYQGDNIVMNEISRLRLGTAAVIKKGEKILLGIRAKEPSKGKWIIPGGGVNFLEPIQTAVKREILEETGLEIDIEKMIGVYEIITPPDQHRVIIYWLANYQSGEVKPSSDISDAKFLSKEEVKSIINKGDSTDIIIRVLEDIGWA